MGRVSITRHMRIVRTGTRRIEGEAKVLGTTRFTGDLMLPGLLHVQLLLSHLPCAQIRAIDTQVAKSAPGVVSVVTGLDLPVQTPVGADQPLATNQVFFAGQPVVAVVAKSEAAAWDSVSLVDVDYEPMPAVLDVMQAIAKNAPIVIASIDQRATMVPLSTVPVPVPVLVPS